MNEFRAFPSTVREEEGEIVPSYERGNGNEPRYPRNDRESRIGECAGSVGQIATSGAEEVDSTEVDPISKEVWAAINRSRAKEESKNTDIGAAYRFLYNREQHNP